ncbi:MAG: hypothetical protein ACI9C2_001882 [Gammaproteobacteria bacterium]|jgi:hypothetical protein
MNSYLNGSILRATFALAMLASLAHAADLNVGPGQPFMEIDEAIAAASPGDRIFVGPGIYKPFDLVKPVEVRGLGPLQTRVLGFVPGDFASVSGIPVGATATISNMAFDIVNPTASTSHPLVDIHANAGTVVLQNVEINLFPAADHVGPGLHATDCKRLIIQASTIRGSLGSPFGGVGDSALIVKDSNLLVTDSDLQATDTNSSGYIFGQPGAPAVILTGCRAQFSRVRATGGSGGTDAFTFLSFPGGAGIDLSSSSLNLAGGPGNVLIGGTGASFTTASGGPGLNVTAGSSVRLAADVNLQGGLNGIGTTPGIPLVIEAGSLASSLGFHLPTLALDPTLVVLGSTFALMHAGEPSASVVPVYSFQLGPTLGLSGIDGPLYLDATSLVPLPMVVLDGAGLGTTLVNVPALSALAGIHVWFQAGEFAGPAIRLSNPARLEVQH